MEGHEEKPPASQNFEAPTVFMFNEEQAEAVKKMITTCMKSNIPIPTAWVESINARMSNDS